MREILLAHGSGGRMSRELIEREIVSRFGDGPLKGLPDGATLPGIDGELVFSSDGFVVQPLFFPGGDIGELAVHGTVNDIAVCGARPRWLSLSMILEEGLSLEVLSRVLDSVKRAAEGCEVTIVTGDTKVVGRGQCDGLFLTTSGIGERISGFSLSPKRLVSGDAVVVSGPIGDHGMAVMAVREGIRLECGPKSDCAPVHRLVGAIESWASSVKLMRDPTRGGLAAVLNELVEGREVGISLSEKDIPVSGPTKAVTELLGIDVLHVACEGRLVAVCGADAVQSVLDAWKGLPEGEGARVVGYVTDEPGRVVLETFAGGRRLIDVPEGELLPRIC